MKTLSREAYHAFVKIIHAELVPATGCTEPIAIAYCAAKARQILDTLPETLSVACSGNIIKNVKGVVVPNSGGLKGIHVAAVLGAVGGDPARGLDAAVQNHPGAPRQGKRAACHSGFLPLRGAGRR